MVVVVMGLEVVVVVVVVVIVVVVVGVVVVVHVLQGPEEDMIQAHLEGEGVVDHQGEEDL